MKKENTMKLYYGNMVYPDGSIYNAIGKRLVVKNGVVRLYVEGKKRTLLAGRVVYEAMTGKKIPKGNVIQYKDGNKNNVALDNIIMQDRKKYFAGHEWSSKFSKETMDKIRAEYDEECPKQHGFRKGNERPSYVDLANKYDCSKSTIIKIIKRGELENAE